MSITALVDPSYSGNSGLIVLLSGLITVLNDVKCNALMSLGSSVAAFAAVLSGELAGSNTGGEFSATDSLQSLGTSR